MWIPKGSFKGSIRVYEGSFIKSIGVPLRDLSGFLEGIYKG